MKVRTRLVALFTSLAALILTLFFVNHYWWMRDSLEAEIAADLAKAVLGVHDQLLDEIDELRRGVKEPLGTDVLDFAGTSGYCVEIRRADGEPVCASAGFAPPPDPLPAELECAGAPWRVRAERVDAGRADVFRVVVGVSTAHLYPQLARMRRNFFVFTPAVLLVAWFLGLYFVGRALAPVEDLRVQAERISRKNLAERVPVPASVGEFHRLALTFNEMLERLERAFLDVQGFAGDAAHELRTPLANLRAALETAIQRPLRPDEVRPLLADVFEEVERLERIVGHLLMLAQIDAGRHPLRSEEVRLRPLLEEARETWQPAAGARRVEIRVEGDEAVVRGDAVALRRVVMNLLENAVNYNRDGGRILCGVSQAAGRVRLRVADTGIGIAPEHLPRLFRRFYRVDPARSQETGGAGLGLSICRALVEAMSGRIDVRSAPGEGTEFDVELPAAG